MSETMTANITGLAYLVASVCFIIALRGLSSPESARHGNYFGIAGMSIAVATTLFDPNVVSYTMIILGVLIGGSIGTVVALKIEMTAATFSGSVIAFLKLQALMTSAPLTFPGQRLFHGVLALVLVGLAVWFANTESYTAFWALTLLAFALGFLMILPIGGADMPVVVSMLNSLSGWAACGIGFTLSNASLIVTGALVGSSGAILSYIMCKGMNRSFVSVILGGFGGEGGVVAAGGEDRPVKSGNADDAAFILANAGSVIIVPGYGMAVAQAQHALKEMCDILERAGVRVRYAIHPVAGRMPGHMNVLLAEANVPYDQVLEMEEINHEFGSTDVTFVIGANDITNPAAHTDPSSAIYGMPILDVEKSGMVLFVKRSLGVGYAGVDNDLFYRDNTMMLFGDAKAMCENVIKAIS
jgi:NAD(P) transhydrogenase subunit beta